MYNSALGTSAADRINRFLNDYPDGELFVAVGYASVAGLAWLGKRTTGRPVTLIIGNAQASRFQKASAAARKPFIFLSAGVGNAEFIEALKLAGESGAAFSGVLCGRATWKEGIPIYAKEGASAFRDWLRTEGVRNIGNVNGALSSARPWFRAYGVETAEALATN